MPLVHISVVENLSRIGIEPSDVAVVLHEVEMENRGIRGGIPANEVELGFQVKV